MPMKQNRPACICWVMLVLMQAGGPAVCLNWLLTAGCAGCCTSAADSWARVG
jgi:hypothetical protein